MTATDLTARVECTAGHRGEAEPVRFTLGSRTVDITDILDRWLAPDHRYFKVLGKDGGIYILRHTADTDRWELTLYERGDR